MYVKIRPLEGMQQLHINISKTATIKRLKDEIEKQLSIKSELQRLYFRGKHMENENTLFDCKVNVNDVIQLSVRTMDNITNKSLNDANEKKESMERVESVTEELIDAESYYYKVGDAIDCVDQIHGAWFEAVIEKISMKKSSEDLVYTVRWEFIEYAEPFNVPEKFIRPRAWHILRPEELKKGQKVMVNHNLDRRQQIGYWYDFEIGNILINGSVVSLTGTLYIGSEAEELQKRKVLLKKYPYAIEEPELIRDRDELEFRARISKEKRAIAANCSKCLDAPAKKCRECSCKVCGGKGDPSRIILCDECDSEYHIDCLSPPLEEIPQDDWYCPICKNDVDEIIKVGDVLKKRNAKSEAASNGKRKRDWGMGMACVGRTKNCTIVPTNHRGPIPGIEVGSSWLYRVGVSEAGVHQPPVAGIHGRETDCAYSIVVSDGYGDIDNGNEFLYTGSGGRDLSGNKRTAKQTSDQELTRANKALALNCNAKFNNKVGATASDWRGGIPVRVVRTYKLAKFSKYAPKEGNRYDGIYKVVKYFPEINEDGYRIWRFLLRRDDPIPAPWTTEGEWRIKQLGLKMQVPDGFEERENCNESNKKAKSKSPRTLTTEKKKRHKVEEYKLDTNVSELIEKDQVNAKPWKECKTYLLNGKTEFLQHVSELFVCVCCQELVFNPVTTPCAHNICRSCLKRSFSAGVYSCPTCRHALNKNFRISVNKTLSMILILLFPGYESGRR